MLILFSTDLGNTSDSACGLKSGVRYCGKYYYGNAVAPPEGPDNELPIRVCSKFSFPS